MELVSLEPPHSADSESLNLIDLRPKKVFTKIFMFMKKNIYFFLLFSEFKLVKMDRAPTHAVSDLFR